jgi:predicted KAP-like P-loop ATPase
LDGDRPITSREKDRLGFAPIAEMLASAIVDQAARDGLVFGIEGQWGSGKTSLINLTAEALAAHGDAAPEVVRFSPWLVGDRDELMHSLFSDLAVAAARVDPIKQAVDAEEAKLPWRERWLRKVMSTDAWQRRVAGRVKARVRASLRLFGAHAGRFGKLIKLGEYAGMPFFGVAGDVLGRIGESAKEFDRDGSLIEKKTALDKGLRTLSRRIVVFVDDIDRLEPSETVEMLRLIRAVADFPNVIYVLSYDRKVVAGTLKAAIQVDDGEAFLEKIVQVSFKVPRPEAFDLRQWFHDEAATLFPEELTVSAGARGDVHDRFAEAVDTQGGRYLTTPRDVVRVLDALRLHAVPVRGQIDVADMVWLQLIRIGKPELYEWIEEYLIGVAAVANGATLQREQTQEIESKLLELLAPFGDGLNLAVMNFERVMPGIGIGPRLGAREDESRIFQNIGRAVLDPLIAERRLGSPQHYRLYFAFAEPIGALKDDDARGFVLLAEAAPDQARARFAELANTARPQGGVMAEVLIDRLTTWADRIQPAIIPAIFAAFAFALDDVARRTRRGDFGEYRGWGLGKRAVVRLLKKQGIDRAACLQALFSEGRSLGWLTSMLRDEIFAHGLYGDRAVPEEERLLTPEEFRAALGTMLERYRSTDPQVLLSAPNLLSLLYGWQQGGGQDDVREWVAARISTDAGLLGILPRLRGHANASDIGEYFPLRKADLDHFLDSEDALRRVQAISSDPKAPKADRQTASGILVAFEQGRRR